KILLNISNPTDIPTLIKAVQHQLAAFIGSLQPQGQEDRQTLDRLAGLGSQLLRKAGGRKASAGGREVTTQTVRRGYEEVLYWRLETLVDLQYLRKVDRDSYVYSPTDSLRDLSTLLDNDYADKFFQHWWKCLGFLAEAANIQCARRLMFEANKD